MSNYIASIDTGNGGTKGELSKPNGKDRKSFYEPSVRAAATGESLGLGKDWELQYDYCDWYGYRYVTGDDVIRVTRRALERHMGSNRYGNEFHAMLTALAIARMGVEKGAVDLTTFAPPGLYNQLKPDIEGRFLSKNGEVEIKLKGDKKPRAWRYDSVTVWPEGIGAAACFVLDDSGEFVPSDVLAGDVVILDIGAHTLDALLLRDGNFNPESLQHATWEEGGVHVHVREPILRALKKRSDEFANITVDDVDRAIRHGAASGDYTFSAGGYEVDLKPLLDKYRERFAGWIGNNIGDGVFNQFRGVKSVILVGGAGLVEDHLKQWYGDKLLDRRQHPTTANLHPIDMNAVGGLRLALMRAKAKK